MLKHKVMALSAERPSSKLIRSNTDIGLRKAQVTRDDENWELRHGWEEQYNSAEYLTAQFSVIQSQVRSFCQTV
jgi:hypothetical protein